MARHQKIEGTFKEAIIVSPNCFSAFFAQLCNNLKEIILKTRSTKATPVAEARGTKKWFKLLRLISYLFFN